MFQLVFMCTFWSKETCLSTVCFPSAEARCQSTGRLKGLLRRPIIYGEQVPSAGESEEQEASSGTGKAVLDL